MRIAPADERERPPEIFRRPFFTRLSLWAAYRKNSQVMSRKQGYRMPTDQII